MNQRPHWASTIRCVWLGQQSIFISINWLGDKGEGMEKYKLVVTKQPWGYRVQPGVYSQYFCHGCVSCQMGTRGIGGSLRGLYKRLTFFKI